VLDTYQATYSDANPGPGALVVYPINSDGSLGTNVTNGSLPYWPVEFAPTTVNVSANGNFVYVANANTNSTATTKQGTMMGFAVGSGGVLTALVNPNPGTILTASELAYAGVQPSASASDPTSRFLYVTDAASNEMYAYTIGANGALTALTNGPFTTGVFPDGITIDPSGTYIYVSNYNSNTISSYQIAQSTGAPSALAGAASYPTKTGPMCILIEPAFGRFLFTANFLDSSVTGYQLSPNTGALTGTENSPYPAAGQPTCAAAVAHGNHPGEHVQATSGNGA
jgi:DNA-binding beta-propeller fold protein YncE